jgi:hypothetical protein
MHLVGEKSATFKTFLRLYVCARTLWRSLGCLSGASGCRVGLAWRITSDSDLTNQLWRKAPEKPRSESLSGAARCVRASELKSLRFDERRAEYAEIVQS